MKYHFATTRTCRGALSLAALLTVLSIEPVGALAASDNHSASYQSDGSERGKNGSGDSSGKDGSGKSDADWNSHSFKSGEQARSEGGAPVPEPSSWILMGTLALGAAALAFRDKNRIRV